MWREIKLLERSYFMKCNFSGAYFTLTLCDGKESWFGKGHLDEVKQKVKVLNRRFEYNEAHIRKTLTDGDLEEITLDTLKEEDEGETSISARENLSLKFKYRVLGRPFNYEWCLKKQTLLEFQETFVKPLFTALLGCQQQIEVLTDNLRKKDAEILQYRKEGAILNRKTLATRLFDFDEFSRKYESSSKLVADFSELGKFIINTETKKVGQTPASPQRKIEKEEEDAKTESRRQQISGSPGQRKRKLLKQQLLETALKTRRKCLEYESSQSQTFSSSQSAEESNKVKMETKNTAEKPESNAKALRSRRASQCTPVKEKNEKKPTDDSDSSDDVKSLTPRKSASRNLNMQSQSVSLKTANNDTSTKNKEETHKNDTTNEDDNKQGGSKNMKALGLSKSEFDEVNLKSPRKRTAATGLNRQTQENCLNYTSNGNLKDKENPTKKNDGKQANSACISNSEKEDAILPSPKKEKMQMANKLTQEKSQKSSNNEIDKMNNKEKAQQKEGLNTLNKTKKPAHYEDMSNSDKDVTSLSSRRKDKQQNENTESVHNVKTKPTENTKKTEASRKDGMVKNKNNNNSVEISDSESDELILTPRKRKTVISKRLSLDETSNCASQDNNINNGKSPNNKRASSRSEQDLDEPSAYVVEISTDSECDETDITAKRCLRKRISSQPGSPSTSTFVLKSRITRSSPQVLTTPTKLSDDHRRRRSSMNLDSDLHNKPLALGEISSQLEAIRKELESLEALRLADLKHRTCKA